MIENYETLNNDADDVEIPVEFFDFLDVSAKCETSVQNSSSSPIVESEEKKSVSSFVRKSVIQKHQWSETEKLEITTATNETLSSTIIDTSNVLKQKGKF